MALGSKLKMMLSERGITVKDFAAKIQIPPTTLYSFIKRDSSTGKLELIAKICKGLDMDISEFLDDDLFDAATSPDTEYEEKIIDEKIKSIVENPEYSEQEKEALLQDLMAQLEIMADMHKRNAEKAHTIIIDTEGVTSHPFYILQEKIKRGEELTEEEKTQFNAYMKDAINSFSSALKKFGETLKECYQLLNDEGQKKADEQISHAVKQVEMLTKIPEYQKDNE